MGYLGCGYVVIFCVYGIFFSCGIFYLEGRWNGGVKEIGGCGWWWGGKMCLWFV